MTTSSERSPSTRRSRLSKMLNSIYASTRERLLGKRTWVPSSNDVVIEVPESGRHLMTLVQEEGCYSIMLDSVIKEPLPAYHLCHRKADGHQFSLFRRRTKRESVDLLSQLVPFACLFSLESTSLGLQRLVNAIMTHPLWNAAHVAAMLGLKRFFENIYESQLQSAELLTQPCRPEGWYPLHIAIKHLNVELVSFMVDKMKLSVKQKDKTGQNAIHHAAVTNSSLVQVLLAGAEGQSCLNSLNKDGCTPLFLAISHGKPSCMAALLKEGAVLNVMCNGRSPLHQAMMQNNRKTESIIRTLTSSSPDSVVVVDKETGNSALHVAAYKTSMLALLSCCQNLNIEARNFAGQTALHVHASNNNVGCVFALIYNDANLNAQDLDGNTALHISVLNQNEVITKALLLFGADPNVLNKNNESARHLAAKLANRNKEFVSWLVEFDAKPCNSTANHHHLCWECDECFKTFSSDGVDNSLENIVQKSCVDYTKSKLSNGCRMDAVLALDGGGIRGIMMTQVLLHLERRVNVPIRQLFGWMVGTSTGALLAAAIAIGRSMLEVQKVYFRLKDALFEGYQKPYSTERLEERLKTIFGATTTMADIISPKLIITSVLADTHPVRLDFFRNYYLPGDPLLSEGCRYKNTSDVPLWKILRCTSAAPTYFSSVDNKYVDGGLIANNPTLDALSEISRFNAASKLIGAQEVSVGCVLSLGTGRIPKMPIASLNLDSKNPLELMSAVQNLLFLLINQVTAGEGSPVERSRSWCHDLKIPYFRFSTPLSICYKMDTKNDEDVVNMMWETHKYLNTTKNTIDSLVELLNLIYRSKPENDDCKTANEF